MNHPKTIQELLALPEEFNKRLQIPTRGYLYHGSLNGAIDILEPRQAISYGRPDGKPAVCAADDIDRSIFISIFNRGILDNPQEGGSGWSRDGKEKTRYRATPNVIERAKDQTGYLYLLDPNDFEWVVLQDPKHGKKRELRSLKAVRPLHKLEVKPSDFPHPIEELNLEDL